MAGVHFVTAFVVIQLLDALAASSLQRLIAMAVLIVALPVALLGAWLLARRRERAGGERARDGAALSMEP